MGLTDWGSMVTATDWTDYNVSREPGLAMLAKLDLGESPHAVINAESGDPVFDGIESGQNPRIAAANLTRDWIVPADVDAVAFVSPGMFYEIEALLPRIPAHVSILIIEPDPRQLRAAMRARDLTWILGHKSAAGAPLLQWYIGDHRKPPQIHFSRWAYVTLRGLGALNIWISGMTAAGIKTPQLSSIFMDEIGKAQACIASEMATIKLYGEQLDTNAIRILPSLVRAQTISDVGHKFSGSPIVIVAAGPSAAEGIDYLSKTRPRLPLVAVDSITRRLCDAGLVPDISFTLDLTEKTLAMYEGVDASAFALYADTDACWKTVAEHEGEIITTRTASAWSQWFHRHVRELDETEKGTGVLFTALDFVLRAGASSVVLVGVDLAFPGERTHADGAVVGWGTGLAVDSPGLIDVVQVGGRGIVRSNRAFATFIDRLKTIAAASRAPIYQTSPAGARIDGTVELDLASAIQREGSKAETRRIAPLPDPRVPTDPDRLMLALEKLREDGVIALARCGRALGYAKSLRYSANRKAPSAIAASQQFARLLKLANESVLLRLMARTQTQHMIDSLPLQRQWMAESDIDKRYMQEIEMRRVQVEASKRALQLGLQEIGNAIEDAQRLAAYAVQD